MKFEKMNTKDIITVTLLTLVNMVIYFVLGMTCVVPVMVLIYPSLIALTQGVVFMMIGTKVPKTGAFLIYSIVAGLLGFYLPYIICNILAGIITEILLCVGGYRDYKSLAVGYVLMQAAAVFGSTIYPYKIAFEDLLKQGTAEQIADKQKAIDLLTGPVPVFVVVCCLIFAVIGALIGIKIVKRHVNAADKGDDVLA
jgi:energy-coupling factor transport system substrate-specific component